MMNPRWSVLDGLKKNSPVQMSVSGGTWLSLYDSSRMPAMVQLSAKRARLNIRPAVEAGAAATQAGFSCASLTESGSLKIVDANGEKNASAPVLSIWLMVAARSPGAQARLTTIYCCGSSTTGSTLSQEAQTMASEARTTRFFMRICPGKGAKNIPLFTTLTRMLPRDT